MEAYFQPQSCTRSSLFFSVFSLPFFTLVSPGMVHFFLWFYLVFYFSSIFFFLFFYSGCYCCFGTSVLLCIVFTLLSDHFDCFSLTMIIIIVNSGGGLYLLGVLKGDWNWKSPAGPTKGILCMGSSCLRHRCGGTFSKINTVEPGVISGGRPRCCGAVLDANMPRWQRCLTVNWY